MIHVQWAHVAEHCQAQLTALCARLEVIEPNEIAGVAACQAAIRAYRDVLAIPQHLARKVEARVEAQQAHR